MKFNDYKAQLANAGIVIGCIFGTLCSFALWTEMGRTADTMEWAKRATVVITPAASAAPEDCGEDPMEDMLIVLRQL